MRRIPTSTILAATAALVLAGRAADAQFGQTAMAPSSGVVNSAAAGLSGLNQNGPGWLYYGINAADRGLGYNGSYMTLGGYIPYAEDGLGGLWAADLRSHLSINGGFFSNVGAVRKQFLGGTVLGLGIYWDYDGDLNQYGAYGTPGTQWGQFGHTYNQVGLSGEWLTDYGNFRSNGYMPVGSTAYTVGAPGSPFSGNYLLCNYGLDAALSGADLEVGAYIPGLSDWAGMISVGGYALGNTRYDWWQGPQTGQNVVPWFGGVYTRLDMTFVENWDFSLQANNDSYFDWTGFARLTYRMGGSRRRNVPDQMEQPMMRNEHIVRAHQTPVAAVNPVTGQAWRVFHVDNAVAMAGNGMVGAPFKTLAQAQAAASSPYDIVYVHQGISAVSPYASNWQFQADNQILVGEGSTLLLNTVTCGQKSFFTGAGGRPVLTSPGTAITLRDGVIVDHFAINDAMVGIAADASLVAGANVNDVALAGGNANGQVGLQLVNVGGAPVNLYNMQVVNMGRGVSIDGGDADVNFQGLVRQNASQYESVLIQNRTGGAINMNQQLDTLQTAAASNPVVNAQPYGIADISSQAPAAINISNNDATSVNIGPTRVTTPTAAGVTVQNNTGVTAVVFNDLIVKNAGNEAFITENNDAAATVAIAGETNSLSSVSTVAPAFRSNDDATLAIQLMSLDSAVAAGTNAAITLQGASTGVLQITDSFLVDGTPGTVAADVTNTTTGVPPVSVTVPAP